MNKNSSSQKNFQQQKILIDLVNCEDNQINFELPSSSERRFLNNEITSAVVIIKNCTPDRITFKVRSNKNPIVYSKPYLGILIEKEKQKKIELFATSSVGLKEGMFLFGVTTQGTDLKLQIAAMELDRTLDKYDSNALGEYWRKAERDNNTPNTSIYIQKVVISLNIVQSIRNENTMPKVTSANSLSISVSTPPKDDDHRKSRSTHFSAFPKIKS
jgi:hypothetical protein